MLSATSRKYAYLYELVSRIDYQKTIDKYLLLKELKVRDTEREIYFDETLGHCPNKVNGKDKGRNYGLGVFRYSP